MTYKKRKKMEEKAKAVFSSLKTIIFSFIKAGIVITMSYFIISEMRRGEIWGATLMFLILSYFSYDLSFHLTDEEEDEEEEEEW